MTKVMFVGDVHGNYDVFSKLVNANSPDVVIQCGDFGYFPNMGTDKRTSLLDIEQEVYFCEGNHEDYTALSFLEEDGCVYNLKNIRHKKRGSVLTIGDKKILFMGGADSVDKRYRTPGFDWFPEEIITERDVYSISEENVDIIVSHTCPESWTKRLLNKSERIEFKDPSRQALDYLLRKYAPSFWYFGHWHCNLEGVHNNTVWRCLDCVDSYDSEKPYTIVEI